MATPLTNPGSLPDPLQLRLGSHPYCFIPQPNTKPNPNFPWPNMPPPQSPFFTDTTPMIGGSGDIWSVAPGDIADLDLIGLPFPDSVALPAWGGGYHGFDDGSSGRDMRQQETDHVFEMVVEMMLREEDLPPPPPPETEDGSSGDFNIGLAWSDEFVDVAASGGDADAYGDGDEDGDGDGDEDGVFDYVVEMVEELLQEDMVFDEHDWVSCLSGFEVVSDVVSYESVATGEDNCCDDDYDDGFGGYDYGLVNLFADPLQLDEFAENSFDDYKGDDFGLLWLFDEAVDCSDDHDFGLVRLFDEEVANDQENWDHHGGDDFGLVRLFEEAMAFKTEICDDDDDDLGLVRLFDEETALDGTSVGDVGQHERTAGGRSNLHREIDELSGHFSYLIEMLDRLSQLFAGAELAMLHGDSASYNELESMSNDYDFGLARLFQEFPDRDLLRRHNEWLTHNENGAGTGSILSRRHRSTGRRHDFGLTRLFEEAPIQDSFMDSDPGNSNVSNDEENAVLENNSRMADDSWSIISSESDFGLTKLFEGMEMSDYEDEFTGSDASSYVSYDGISEDGSNSNGSLHFSRLSELEELSNDNERTLGLEFLFGEAPAIDGASESDAWDSDHEGLLEEEEVLGLATLFEEAPMLDAASESEIEASDIEDAVSGSEIGGSEIEHAAEYNADALVEDDWSDADYLTFLRNIALSSSTHRDWRMVEADDDNSDTQSARQDDPDEYTYEELLRLGDIIGHAHRGLSSDAIASLPSVKYTDEDMQDGNIELCVICQSEYEIDEILIVLSCKHSYHSECISKWLKIKKRCPLCSTEVFAAL